MNYVNVNTTVKGKLEVKTSEARIGIWGLFFYLSIFAFVLYVVTLGQVEMGFFIKSQYVVFYL